MKKKKDKNISKADFKEDVKSKKGLLKPLKKLVKRSLQIINEKINK